MAEGDHIAVARKRLFVTYYHHGIDVGNGNVIHLCTKKDARVVENSISEFLKGGEKEVIEYVRFIDVLINYKSKSSALGVSKDWMLPFLDDERIDEIRKRIEEPRRAVGEARKHLHTTGYNLFSDNCEHFAVFCKTGLRVSLQAIEYQKLSDRIFDMSISRSWY